MIIGKDFVWSHIPKTGGTSTKKMFEIIREQARISWIDSDLDVRKHDSYEDKSERLSINLSDRVRISGIRRLPHWVLSSRNHMKPAIPCTRSHILDGVVYCFIPLPKDKNLINKLNETCKKNRQPMDFWLRHNHQHTPDSVLEHFIGERIDHWIRVEYLSEDFINTMSKIVKINSDFKTKIRNTHLNKRKYNTNIKDFFKTKTEMKRLYDRNPLWSKIERECYGNLLYEVVY